VLISLLVYHFRQRIIVLESKNDTMFEIINNIVKEITNVRNTILYMNPESTRLMDSNSLMNTQFEYTDTHTPFDDEDKTEIEHFIVEDYPEHEDDDDEDEDDEDEDNEDEDDDDDEDENDEDDEDEDEEETVNNTQKIVVSLDDVSIEQPVKIVNVNIESDVLDIEEINDLATEDNNSLEEEQIVDIDVNAETVIVHKILDELDRNVDEDITVEESKTKDVYRNMNTNQLKQLVITKGLSTNPSKLKKNELLQLLENSD
jgi:hypothetical protein